VSLLVLTSAKGAPGVTSLALLLASLPNTVSTVLIEADEVGSSLAARFTLDTERGINQLYRREFNKQTLLAEAQPLRLAPQCAETSVVVGLSSEGRRLRLAEFWASFAPEAAADPETLYIVDAGRQASDSPTRPLLQHANFTLLVSGTRVEDIFHTEQLVRRLKAGEVLRNADIVVMGKGAYGIHEIARSFSISVAAGLPTDTKAADVLDGAQRADDKFMQLPLVKDATRLQQYVATQTSVAVPQLENIA
jgi:hypothetical protein